MKGRKVFRVESAFEPQRFEDISFENLKYVEIPFEDLRYGDRFLLQDPLDGAVPPVERGDCIYAAVTDSYLQDGVFSVDIVEDNNIQLEQSPV